MSQASCLAAQIKDPENMMNVKIHKRILRFFSKIDNSKQMGPLINNAIKRQRHIIPGPKGFKHRSAKDVRRAQLLEHYDGDSFFSEQAFKRLQLMRTALSGNAFLKLMQVLVAIFDVYMATKEGKHRSLAKGNLGKWRKSKMVALSMDENNNLLQCAAHEGNPKSSRQILENSVKTSSDKFSINGKVKGLHQIKLKSCSGNVEKSPPRETLQVEKKMNRKRKVLAKGDNYDNKDCSSIEDNSPSRRLGIEDNSECLSKDTIHILPQVSGTECKDFLSTSSKRHYPITKGDNHYQNKRRKTSSKVIDGAGPAVEKCARLRVWSGSM